MGYNLQNSQKMKGQWNMDCILKCWDIYLQFHFHFDLIRNKENESKMEIWISNFDENLNMLLDKLNSINTAESRQRLVWTMLILTDIVIAYQQSKW